MSREPKANPQHGRKANQKMKPYLVMEYLMRQTDENHAESADNIVAYLQEVLFLRITKDKGENVVMMLDGLVRKRLAEVGSIVVPQPSEVFGNLYSRDFC